VWGDLFNLPDCGFVQSGRKREANNSRPELPYTQLQIVLKANEVKLGKMAGQVVRPRPRGQVFCRSQPARTRAHHLA